jgi:hypothetical protein
MNLKAGWGPLTLLLCILLAACAAWIHIMAVDGNLRWRWVVVVGILIALCLVAGVLVNGRLAGILIDDRNRISLARLQWVAWLIVVLSGYFVEALWNAAQTNHFPEIQPELFILLGIVSGSPVVSNLIVDAKKRAPESPPTSQVQQTEPRLAEGDSPRQKELSPNLVTAGPVRRRRLWADGQRV